MEENIEHNLDNTKTEASSVKPKNSKKGWRVFLPAFLIILVFFFYAIFFKAPKSFPVNEVTSVVEGDSLRKISSRLKSQGYIKSRAIFETFVVVFGGEKRIKPGLYKFERKLDVHKVAQRISFGQTGIDAIRVTVPEGFTVEEVADLMSDKLDMFNKSNFLASALLYEGYLFPDTYFFNPNDDEEVVFELMRENFDRKTKELFAEAGIQTDEDIKEMVVMASLVEGEANGDEDRGMISGILWKRLSIGMALQVDVAEITYEERGLPKKPIANPGLASLEAAVYPEESDYLYYLHDPKGNIHYGKNFDEHRQNIQKYLR